MCQHTAPGQRGKSGRGRRPAWSTRRTNQPEPTTQCGPVIRPRAGTSVPVGATPAEGDFPGSQAGTVGPPPVKTQVGSLKAGTRNERSLGHYQVPPVFCFFFPLHVLNHRDFLGRILQTPDQSK